MPIQLVCINFYILKKYSGGGPVHAHVPIHAHTLISPTQSQLHNKLPMYMTNLVIIYVVVNSFSMKNHKSLRKLRMGVNRYTGVNWSTTTKQTSPPFSGVINVCYCDV